MVRHRNETVGFRRKRKGKTNYSYRIKILSSQKLRLVVRRSLNNFLVQIIEYSQKGDKVLASASSRELIKKGWNYHRGNIPSAYLTGLLLGKKASEKKIKSAILDIGNQTSNLGNSLYAVLKGVVDAGIEIPCNEKAFPSEDAISGKKIADYALKLKKEDQEKYNKQFSKYIKNKVSPEDITSIFQEVKKKITASVESKGDSSPNVAGVPAEDIVKSFEEVKGKI